MPWPSHWSGLADLAAMGGYAAYVWGSVAACGMAFALEVLGLRARRRRAVAAIRVATHSATKARPEAGEPPCP